MTKDQRGRAQALLALHSAHQILVLPNVWNPIGARVLVAKGYSAVATASAAISASLGYLDGQRISRRTMLDSVSRISHSVHVPVTADMESGYAASLDELAETTDALIDAGAVGMNIEDSLEEGGLLRPIDEQVERIARVRETASARDLHLVINARIDSFVSGQFEDREQRIEDAVARAAAYAQAGADCVYPMGPGDVETLTLLRAQIELPINVLATPDAASIDTLAKLGINRVSFGPFLFRSCLQKFSNIADALARSGGYECFATEMMSRAEVSTFLTSGGEHTSE